VSDPTQRALLGELAATLGRDAILWRGADLGGSDVDLLVTPGATRPLARFLSERGLVPEPGDPGHVVWTAPGSKPLDVLSGDAWPGHYPALEAITERLLPHTDLPPEPAPEDRLLILGAEAVAGRPVHKIVRRARPLLAADGVADRLAERAREQCAAPIGALISDPDGLERLARRGRLPYGYAVRLALRSPRARAALQARVAGRLSGGRRAGRPRSLRRPLLISLSGMDGAGKSTAAEGIRDHLTAQGLPARIEWARIGGESKLLDTLATPVKRLLGREGTVADPIAAGGPDIGKVQDPRAAAGRRGPVTWTWVVIVAAANASSYRRAARQRRDGVSVVSDRWVIDAVVDVDLRYGRHAVAAAVLRWLAPRTDLSVLLQIDAATAAARKPGDQALHVLEGMEERYSAEAEREQLAVVDARRPPEQVLDDLLALVDRVLDARAA